jgi:tetratricopeptide (TPR) repeat protein
LADSYSVLASTAYSFSPREPFSKGAVAARKALQIDETLAEAHASLAQSNFYALNWLAAEKELKRSIELNPSYATAHHWYALYFTVRERFDEGLAEANRACALDPLSVIINRDLGLIYYYARQPDRAIEQYQKTLELDQDFALSHQGLGRAYLEKGMPEEAISEIQRAVRLSRRSAAMLATLAHAYAVTGKPREARKILRDLRARSRRSYVSPASTAVVFGGLGDKETALEWLEIAYQQRDPGLHTLKVHPVFDSLRSEPHFRDLVRRMRFPQ